MYRKIHSESTLQKLAFFYGNWIEQWLVNITKIGIKLLVLERVPEIKLSGTCSHPKNGMKAT